MRVTRPSWPTIIDAIRPWDVWPRKPFASATPLKASTATSVAPTIRMARFCPRGATFMRVRSRLEAERADEPVQAVGGVGELPGRGRDLLRGGGRLLGGGRDFFGGGGGLLGD